MVLAVIEVKGEIPRDICRHDPTKVSDVRIAVAEDGYVMRGSQCDGACDGPMLTCL